MSEKTISEAAIKMAALINVLQAKGLLKYSEILAEEERLRTEIEEKNK